MSQYTFLDRSALPSIPELPDPFLKPDGSRVCSPEEWDTQREYLKEMLATYMYGHMPPNPGNTTGEVRSCEEIHDGRAIREIVHIECGPEHAIQFDVVVVRPNKPGKFPVFTWNHFKEMTPSPAEYEAVCQRDYAIAYFDKEQLAPDNSNFATGIAPKAYPDYDWRAIAVWAWGHSRIIDYLETTDYADMSKIISTGHSRGGKTAMCAAIYDDRIAACASSGSGCGGAGCYRFLGGRFGEGVGPCETLGSMLEPFRFWYWFVDSLADYGHHGEFSIIKDEPRLPFDLHFLKALIAPRPLITTDGLDDIWANPFGTQVTWRAAEEVYRFLGAPRKNAMHYREGGHKYRKSDWLVVLDFMDKMLLGKDVAGTYATVDETLEYPYPHLHFDWRAPQGK
ncbi:MAG: hypothetical protein ACLRVT_05185 [Oscillospiraceae bacterium]